MNNSEINENYRQQYDEVCRSYHAIHNFRANLLALLPIASGFGGLMLLTKTDSLRTFFTPIGILGAIVTVGLYIYEVRGTHRCFELKKVAKELEKLLGLNSKTAQFLGEPKPVFRVVREGVAGGIIYLSVLIGWVLIAVYGLKIICKY